MTDSGGLEVLTPTYRPDLDLCRDLNRSLRRHGGSAVTHRIVVPRRDLDLIRDLAGPSTILETAEQYLPRSFWRVPGNIHVNLRRPVPPVRGWVTQQIVKLSASAASDKSLVVVADSDLVFVKSVDLDTFRANGSPMFYRLPDGVHAGLPRHVEWHRTARRVLGLPSNVSPPLPDYICWPCAWEPAIVRQMLAHIETVHRPAWQTTLAGCLHLSEMVLYGVFVDEVLGGRDSGVTTQMRCLRHTEESAFDTTELARFLEDLSADDIAVMISAKSGTGLAERRAALAGRI